jgi:histidinol-phosphate aminotransferase
MANNKVDYWQTEYDSIKRYNAVPTEQKHGRLHLNENLFKPSPKCIEVLSSITYEDVFEYDLAKNDCLEIELSKYLNLPIENIFVHNGSAEVIKTILSIVLNKGDTILIPKPNWSYYKSVADVKSAKCEYYDVLADKDTYYHDIDGILSKAKTCLPKIIVITTPHMPTGNIIEEKSLEKIVADNPQSLILIDEAYWGFSDYEYNVKRLINEYSNIIFTRTFSKYFGLANMRIGYAICSPHAKNILGLDLPLFRASVVSRNMAIAALQDKDYYENLKKEVIKIREWFIQELNKISGVKPYKSYSNFIFIHLDGYDVQKIKNWMEENGIIVRLFIDKDKLAIRITVAPHNIMEQTLSLFSEACKKSVL